MRLATPAPEKPPAGQEGQPRQSTYRVDHQSAHRLSYSLSPLAMLPAEPSCALAVAASSAAAMSKTLTKWRNSYSLWGVIPSRRSMPWRAS